MGDVDAKAETRDIDSGEQVAEEKVLADLLGNLADQKKAGRNTFDGKTGASLKLTVLRTKVVYGRWSLVEANLLCTRTPLRLRLGMRTGELWRVLLAHPALLQPRLPL